MSASKRTGNTDRAPVRGRPFMGRPVAQVFPPGEFIREELEARGWTQRDLAEVLGRPLQTVNAIINGKKEITPRMAVELAAAFGTSPELWMNWETAYRLALAGPPDPAITARAAERMAGDKTESQRMAAVPR
jgi:HTH-type transcriptional regulator / antitoxin HigA